MWDCLPATQFRTLVYEGDMSGRQTEFRTDSALVELPAEVTRIPEEVLLEHEQRCSRSAAAGYRRPIADKLDVGGDVTLSAGEQSVTLDRRRPSTSRSKPSANRRPARTDSVSNSNSSGATTWTAISTCPGASSEVDPPSSPTFRTSGTPGSMHDGGNCGLQPGRAPSCSSGTLLPRPTNRPRLP